MIIAVAATATLLSGVTPARADDTPVLRMHLVEKGQTLYSIARRYGVPLKRLVSINGIANPSRILAGTRLIVPASPDLLQDMFQSLIWPVEGRVVSRYGRPRRTHRHQGIDIGAGRGTPIRAVADGVVEVAAENRGSYGRLVTIEHGGGLVSYYGHNMKNLVVPGQQVAAGTIIALVGHTGNASGDHLHFELRYKGVPLDPLMALSPPVTARARTRAAPHEEAPSAQR